MLKLKPGKWDEADEEDDPFEEDSDSDEEKNPFGEEE